MMKANAMRLPTIIKLDVSGTKFSVSKEKLLQYKGSLFEQILSTNHPQQLSSGEIFLERTPKYFQHIIHYLLSGTLQPSTNKHKQRAIEHEFEYFNIPVPLAPTPALALVSNAISELDEFEYFNIPLSVHAPASVLYPAPVASLFLPRGTLSGTLIGDGLLGDKIREWLPQRRFQLLYKANIDGFSAKDFHQHCDDKGPTFTVIQSTGGYLFGGYTPLPWDSGNVYKTHADMFIFTLINPHNIPPAKYLLKQKPKYGIECYANYGPSFGIGGDLRVYSNSHQTNDSYTNFPRDYIDTTGKADTTFTGARNFTTNEIEVYSVL